MPTTYSLPDGRTLTHGVPFVLGDVQYPPNWLELAASDDLSARSITRTVISDPQPVPTADDVNRERDRRIALIAFGGHTFDGREVDLARIDRVKGNASVAIINGAKPGDLRWADPDVDFAWIDHSNTAVPMDAETCLAFGVASASWEGRHIVAARKLKNMPTIPADYAANKYWPTE